jgi:hypothetical protein
METWSFINFLALIMYFRIYKQLLYKSESSFIPAKVVFLEKKKTNYLPN